MRIKKSTESGFSLIEILVGLVIGLVVSLVIMQTFSVFEGQKRTTAGVTGTQTNGSVALYNIIRDVQMAGFGLPLFNPLTSPVKCDTPATIDHDNDAATAPIDLFPIVIIDGGAAAGASDQIAVRYGFSYTPPAIASRRHDAAAAGAEFPINPGISVDIFDPNNATTTGIRVSNNRGCQSGDVALASKFNAATGVNACTLTRVTESNADLDLDTKHIKLNDLLPTLPHVYTDGSISCLGRWTEVRYRVGANNVLEKSGQPDDTINQGLPGSAFVPIVADVVNIQAQYGIADTTTSNQVTHWVNATGNWAQAALTFSTQNRIKSVRIAVVTRSGLLEKNNVTNTCTTAQGTNNNGPCAWDDSIAAVGGVPAGDLAPKIDLSNDANWRRYRYRVFETIIPIRNIAWNRGNL